ncbi:MAG: signal peptidase I [Deltaproteobacteria bacterium]|nr:signal peptidase I [Deltaproteobacteria bacterium]
MDDREAKKVRRDAVRLARESAKVLRHRGRRLAASERDAVKARLSDLDQALAGGAAPEKVRLAADALRAELNRHADRLKRASVIEYVESLGTAIGIALLIRAFIIEAFKIPTGSMIPTLMIDDHIFVNKFTYGLRVPFTYWRMVELGQPERGEIAVFEFPGEGEDKGKDFIKRIVAVPGDRVRLSDNRLFLNGEPIPTEVTDRDATCSDESFQRQGCRCVTQRERLGEAEYVTQHLAPPPVNVGHGCVNGPDWPSDNPIQFNGDRDAEEVTVPPGHVLAMGDNRDNSSDGRYWGFIPIENLKGRALFTWWPPGRWFHAVR